MGFARWFVNLVRAAWKVKEPISRPVAPRPVAG
jgi:hypothetical protein